MAKSLITLGHGPGPRGWDPGAQGNGTTEAAFLRGDFFESLLKYAGDDIDIYEENMYTTGDAYNVKGYDDVIELHLDAASAAAKGGHVIIYKGYSPDAMDHRLGNVIKKHFGLRGGVMFDGRNDLGNLNIFTKRKISYRLLELGYITNKANMDHFKANSDAIAKELVEAILNKSVTTSKPKPAAKKSVTDIAKEVIAGKWGNGSDRTSRLKSAGYDATAVQNKVNELLNGTPYKSVTDIAKEVIAGKWGNGSDRQKKLEAAGYNYSDVQKKVNQLL